ncbi:hypothetical protein IC757_00170 [Wenzhouxiangella sp. AB-CW3]|uniref:hypothetical protein n=1 Tax=Wenzhouxiangella sp. AB-CW3 TaxID=2771012 RepID=UPI00168B9630|nr:hypothetical protein [Wenzhouxiangella sp. AB-CW3]QOC22632.1 hypothetical protein IC757_00170 [Wenzhouxiangella sp. AB-CW3]
MNIRVGKLFLIPVAVIAMMTAPMLATAGPPEAQGQGHGPLSNPHGTNVLEVITRHPPLADAHAHYEFVLSDEVIPAGWTTIRMSNHSSSTHFGYMVRVPDDVADLSVEEYMDALSLPFQDAWDPYFAGDVDVGGFFDVLLPGMPEWSAESVPSSGPGFTSGGMTSSMTVYLEPGTYFIECYVLDTEGVFHTTHGMVNRLEVVDDSDNESSEPASEVEVRISSTEGLRLEAENLQPGPTTFEVIFEDNIVYGHGLGHDVHLVRLDGETTVEEINGWINYLDIGADGYYADSGALVSASGQRGPQTFLGGVQTLFPNAGAGQDFPLTAYFHADLTPGQYVLVSEVPNPVQPDADNPEVSMLVEFSVTPGAGLTGAWYDPATAGQGWNFIATPGGVFGYFYGYADSGETLWLITEEVIGDISTGESVAYNLLYGELGSFSDPVQPDDLSHWGEVTFVFDSCNQATAEISGADGAQTHQLQRVADTVGVSCGL